MKLIAFKPLAGALAAQLAMAALLGACSSTPDAGDVAGDTLGLARERPGQIVLEEAARTAATPYGGHSARVDCVNAARDIARLTVHLGPDLEAPAREAPEEDEDATDGGLERTREFASDVSDDLPETATDAAVDAVVGLNPARPVVRFFGRAGEAEAAARRERELALKRRAWLRGAFDALECDRTLLIDSLEREGLATAHWR